MARPSHKPTDAMRDQVSRWSAAGLTQERIAAMIGICIETLRKHYAQDYDGGTDAMVSKLFDVEYDVAIDKEDQNSQKARQFLLKTRGKYSEKQDISLTGDMKVDVTTTVEIVDVAKTNPE